MKFLVDEDLPRSTAALICQFSYEAEDVRDIGLRGASDDRIAAYVTLGGEEPSRIERVKGIEPS